MGLRDLAALATDPPARRRRSGRRSSPSRAPARARRRTGRRPPAAGWSRAMPSTLACADPDHQVVVGRVVGDVAGAVGLLDAADAVLEAGRAGDRPRAGQRLGVAQVRPEHLGAVVVRVVGLGRELHATGRAGPRRPGSATARSRWPGSRRRAGRPACGTSVAIRQASIAASKQSDGERGATIGTGASPLRPNIACSRSDCSVLVGSPVEGPPRWTSTMTSGSSSETARPIVSDFSATPGPGRRGHRRASRRRPRRARRRCRRSRPRPGRCGRRSACACSARAGCPRPA